MKLKICGINDPDFAVKAAEKGVDYLGFIFHAASPRYVTPEKAAAIVAALPANGPRKVGVFVSQSVEEIVRIMKDARLDIVQLHRRASSEDVAALRTAGYEVWTLAGGTPGDGVLFDSSHGDGETVFRKGPYLAILAGKIGVGRLKAALALDPDVLDVNSSLEIAPGVKSVAKLEEFTLDLGAAFLV